MEDINSISWTKEHAPKRVLAIRLQAIGDTVITLPYLQSLRRILPVDTRLDFLTREEASGVPQKLALFDKVYCIKGGRIFRKQLVHTLWLLPKLLLKRYDVVIDLQNNALSKLVRKCIMPTAWSEFDRFSPLSAGERTRLTIEAAGLGPVGIDTKFLFNADLNVEAILRSRGWDGISRLVVLNPAGAFRTRNWPLDNYVAFANLWQKRFPETQFVITGLPAIANKAAYLRQRLSTGLIDLTDNTSAAEAFAIMQKAWFVLSEDSGLMHMAWVNGVPTIALFGSSRSDWSRPLGEKSLLLSSDDLPCGNCLLEDCKYGDVHCLTRYTAAMVAERVPSLLGIL